MVSQTACDAPDDAAAVERAIQDYQAGRIAAAEYTIRRVLAEDGTNPDALHLMGMIVCDGGDAQDALCLIDAAILAKPDKAAFHNTRALALTGLGRLAEAEAAYRTAWSLWPGASEIANNLGCLLRDRGDIAAAVTWLARASELAPGSADISCNLADALAAQGAQGVSFRQFQHALSLRPGSADIHFKLGRLQLSLAQFQAAEQTYRVALDLRPDHAPSHNNLGLALQGVGRSDEAAQCFREALRHDPNCADSHYNLGCLLLLANRLDEARECHERAIAAAPLHGAALWARCMVELPVLYKTPDQILRQRARYTAKLKTLVAHADNPAVAQALARSAGSSQPFFLPYQGLCDRALQSVYGALIARLLRAETGPLAPPPAPGEVIRIGIVSGFFCEHTIWRLMLRGWLSQFDRRYFTVHAYHTGLIEDGQTALARQTSDRFVGGPGTDIRAAILADRPHVLIYPELGMDPIAVRLAAERLAPVQCVAWGQPQTSGLPTMDFFLSSAMMEPECAAAHYTERLVMLPNLGICYTPDERTAVPCSRATLGLRDDAVVFWCGQALYKYLPQYDDVFARIASQLDDSQFLFIGFEKTRAITAHFRARLERAFAAHGLDVDRHCVFLKTMPQEDFLGTIRLADIMLDSIGWSGGKSTLDALAESPAIVTQTGSLMRGRHTAAILTRIGVTETIAATTAEYVDIAVRLARHPDERLAVRARMEAGKHRALGDTAPIRALESLLAQAVALARAA
jgi:predicted O-linked N-acetylglucosamine transferase (SPINDLY family)